jgi:hypothetical protein
MKELEGKSIVVDGELSALKLDNETVKMNLTLMNRQLKSLPSRIIEGTL